MQASDLLIVLGIIAVGISVLLTVRLHLDAISFVLDKSERKHMLEKWRRMGRTREER
jgi:hypothetical protein